VTEKRPYFGGGRKRTGTLIPPTSPTGSYSFKYWTTVDGVEIRKTVSLDTRDDRVAAAKAKRLIKDGGADYDPKAAETFAQAAERIVQDQRADGLATWEERLSRIKNYCGRLADMPVSKITEVEIDNLLRAAAEGKDRPKLSQTTLDHIHTDLSGIFKELYRTRAIAENPMDRARKPRAVKADDKREPVLLDDAEFFQLVESEAVPEWLRTMAVAMRYVGGQRTSDAHAWDWSHFDLKSWHSARVFRPKTEKRPGEAPVVLATLTEIGLHKYARDRLKAWWESQGKPTKGPVFPVRKGDRAGERQSKRSYARDLRHYLWEAGVHRPLTADKGAADALRAALMVLRQAERALDAAGNSKRRAARAARLAAEQEAKALDALQTETDQTLPVQVHSFRRAYATGLAAAGVAEQLSMALAGHANSATHKRYVKLGRRTALEAPEAALPQKPRGKRQKSASRTFASD